MFQTSPLYEINYNCQAPIIINQGGTSSGKTYSLDQVLFTKLGEEDNQICTVVGQDIPNLKAGALRDALDIYNNTPYLHSLIKSYNKTDRIFEYYNGSIMEFKSFDSSQDAKSGKRDYLFCNEVNGIPHAIYAELALRTKKQVFMDYNPNSEFFVHDKLIGRKDVQLFITDHRHNPFCPERIRDKVEALKDEDEELWKVYARGMTGKIEGLILRNWVIVEDIPKEAKYDRKDRRVNTS